MDRQPWEYLEVIILADRFWTDSTGRSGELRELTVRGEGHDLDVRPTAPLLNELGQEGWELVAPLVGDNLRNYHLLLKRPRVP